MYGKIIDGKLEYAKDKYTTETGLIYYNFLSQPHLLFKNGFKFIIDQKPYYDSLKETLEVESYTEDDFNITINYKTVALIKREEHEKLIKKIEILEEENIDFLVNMFEIDFRLFEVECLLMDDLPSSYTINKSKTRRDTMARTQYEQAKKLILLGEYNRQSMEYKLSRYLQRNVITQEQFDELISLMDNDELTEKF